MNHERVHHFPVGVWRQEAADQDQRESICEARGENKAEADDPQSIQRMAEINQDTPITPIAPIPIPISATMIDTALSHQGRS
jgi:hypothetical protein